MKGREAKDLTDREKSKIADIARRYYEDHIPQTEIAKDLGMSQAEVSRCLKLAEEKGIVRIKIDPFFTTDLKQKLSEKFPHLKEVIITPLADSPNESGPAFLGKLGMECARYFMDIAHHGATIGLSCGNSVHTFTEAIGKFTMQGARFPIGCRVYPLIILMLPEVVAVTPAALVANLVRWLPDSRGKAFQLPSVVTDQKGKAYAPYREHPEIRDLCSEIEHLDYYIIGIGMIDRQGKTRIGKMDHMPTHEFNSLIWKFNLIEALKKYDAQGESIYQPFDKIGNFLIDKREFEPLRNRILYLPLRCLRDHVQANTARVIAVSGGEIKHEAIYGALRAKIFNVLITDSWTAEYVLEKEEQGESS